MAVQKGADKWKAKQWFDVYAPRAISTEVIGSIPAQDEKAVIGRIMKVNLNWITHNPNHAFTAIGLRVKDANGNVANTDVDYLAQQFSYLHSLVKRRADAIYTHDRVRDREGSDVVLKLLVTTKARIPKKTKTDIRKAVSAFVKEYVAAKSKEELIKSLISSDLQAEGMKRLATIAPIAKTEIKRIEF